MRNAGYNAPMERWKSWLPAAGFGVLGVLSVWMVASVLEALHEAVGHNPFQIDGAGMAWVHTHTPAGWAPFLLLLTYLLSDRGLLFTGAVFLLAAVLLRVRGYWREAVGLATAMLQPLLGVFLAKLVFARPRPDVSWALAHERSFSFPSGHSAQGVVFYGMAAYLVWKLSGRRWLGIAAVVLAAFLSLATGYSRVYLGVHYPTDVLAGLVVGLIWLTTGILVVEALHELAKPRLTPLLRKQAVAAARRASHLYRRLRVRRSR